MGFHIYIEETGIKDANLRKIKLKRIRQKNTI